MLINLKKYASIALLAACCISPAAAIEPSNKPASSGSADKEKTTSPKQVVDGDSKNSAPKSDAIRGLKSGPMHDPACIYSSYAVTGFSVTMSIYSTFGYGPCDIDIFDKMNTPSIRASMATMKPVAYDIVKMGAIRSTATNSQYSLNLPYQYVGPLKFTMIAQTILPVGTIASNPDMLKRGFVGAPYTPYPSIEKSYFYWAPGTLLFELIDPSGKKYVMTNYSNQYFKDITLEDLKYLDQVLKFPKGWSFQMRVTPKVLEVRTKQRDNFTILRVVDDLANLYIAQD
jgi:hypothetical protein